MSMLQVILSTLKATAMTVEQSELFRIAIKPANNTGFAT